MRPGFTSVCVALLLFQLSSSPEAHAVATAQLSFSSDGASCPGLRSMRIAVGKRLGYDPFEEVADLRVAVTIMGSAGTLLGVARFERSDVALGQREMTAELGACPGLVDSLALAISLALDPDAVDRPRLPRRPRESMSGGAGQSRLAVATLRRQTSEQAELPQAARPDLNPVEGGLWARLGEGPQDALGLSLGWGVRGDHLSTGLELRARLPATRSVSGVELTTYSLSVALRGCLEGDRTRACLLGEVGAEHGIGDGLSETSGVWSSTGAVGMQAALRILSRNRWELLGVSELMVPLVRRLYSSGDLELWQSPAVSLGVGLSARWSGP